MSKHSAVPGVEELVTTLVHQGVRHAVISPGSRNAPISIALFNRKEIEVNVVADERSAAYFALGKCWRLGEPVAIVCTSGSAALNYYPAVSEAFYRHLPLIVITADRPAEWIDQGDGQTIRQDKVYANHIKYSVTLPDMPDIAGVKQSMRLVQQGIGIAQTAPPGPVHINFPLREPLYIRTGTLPAFEPEDKPLPADKMAGPTELREFELQYLSSEKTLILCGQMHPENTLNDVLNDLGKKQNTFILTETTANLDLSEGASTIDRLIDGLTGEEKIQLAPDVLITLGDAVVSKKVKAWLRKSTIRYHLHIGATQSKANTYLHLSRKLEVEPHHVLAHVADVHVPASNYREHWINLVKSREKKHHEFIHACPWSDLKVFSLFYPHVPPGTLLHLANSTPIRYDQLFGYHAGLQYDSNRGTSGIDGCVSTAAGAALHHKSMTCVITGDIGFYYDSNALWNKHLSENFRILLINNSGGNIFRVIEGPEDETEMQTLLETHQEMTAENICKQFNIHYLSAHNENELTEILTRFWNKNERPVLLEVFTDNKLSPDTLKEYFKHLKS